MAALDDYLLRSFNQNMSTSEPIFGQSSTFSVRQSKLEIAPDLRGGGDIAAAEAAGKSIVVVLQGSAFLDLQALSVPTLKALPGNDDALVIGTSVIAVPEDVPGPEVSPNARIARFVPFDRLLPEVGCLRRRLRYCDKPIAACVATIHTDVVNDGALIGVAAGYRGISVNLKTSNPTTEQIGDAINIIIGDAA